MKHNHESTPPERKPGWPDSLDDVINKYGTYEVQATNGTESRYPQIAQGLSQREIRQLQRAAEEWRRKGPKENQ